MVYYVILWCTMLYYAILCYTILNSIMPDTSSQLCSPQSQLVTLRAVRPGLAASDFAAMRPLGVLVPFATAKEWCRTAAGSQFLPKLPNVAPKLENMLALVLHMGFLIVAYVCQCWCVCVCCLPAKLAFLVCDGSTTHTHTQF